MRAVQFGTGEFYHVYNLGTEKRITFQDAQDYVRFLRCIEVANRDNLVGISVFALMPNHFHFALRQEQEGGISKFTHRAFTAYGKYFNTRHDRKGRLWSSPFKAKHIDSQSYLYQIMKYVHENPLDLSKSPLLTDDQRHQFLSVYPWSSYRHYCGFEVQPIITSPLPELFEPINGRLKPRVGPNA